METKAQQAIELRKKAGENIDKMSAITAKVEKEERNYTEEEDKQYKTLENEVEGLQKRAARLEKQAEQEARSQKPVAKTVIPGEAGGASEKREKQKLISQYRFAKVIKAQMPNAPKLDGIEEEMRQEAVREAKEAGVQLDPKGIAVPGFFMSANKRYHNLGTIERRDLTVGTDADGGYTVATDLGELIPALRPRLKTIELGATLLSGLTGNLDIPRQTAVASASWKAENAASDESDATFDKISLTPNRLTAFTDVSNTLLTQSDAVTEAFVRRDLEIAVQTALDLAAINGSGTAPEPKGILNYSGIGSVAGGTNGAAPTLAHIIDLESEIAIDNADVINMAYLTTPGVRGKLKKTVLDAGSGFFIWQGMELNGYGAHISTQVPSDLTKGSGTDLHAIIFGNWQDLLIGQWGGVNILVNPYTRAKEDIVEVVVHSYWDVDLRHEESFAAMKDADIS